MHMPRRKKVSRKGVMVAVQLLIMMALWSVGAGAAKQPQTLTAVPELYISSEQESFPLDELQAQTNVPLSEEPRLTYIVEEGGDVIRLEGSEVQVIGWGDATIRILSDETVGYTAAQQVVDIHIVQEPELLCTVSEIRDASIRFDISMGNGSYLLTELRDWSVQYRARGDEAFRPVDLAWLQSAPFYFTLTALQPETAYELVVQATVTDKLTGEDLLLEKELCVRTRSTAPGSGMVEGTVRCATPAQIGGNMDVSLQQHGAMLAVQYNLPNGGAYAFTGLPDGIYQVMAQSGHLRTTRQITLRDGEAAPMEMVLDGRNYVVEYLSADVPAMEVHGLDALVDSEPVPERGNAVEYRLTCSYVDNHGKPQVWRAAADDTAAGMCLALGLRRLMTDSSGYVQSDKTLGDVGVSVAVELPERMRDMSGYQVFFAQEQDIREVECSSDGRTIEFAVVGAGEYTVFYRDPAYIYSETLSAPEPAEQDPLVSGTEQESAPEQNTQPAETVPISGKAAIAIGAGILAVLVLVLLIVRRRRPTPPPDDFLANTGEDGGDGGDGDKGGGSDAPDTPGGGGNWDGGALSPEPEFELAAPDSPAEPVPELEFVPEPELVQKPQLPVNRRLSPWEEGSFFDGMIERKELKARYDHGEIEEESFKEQERDILLRM